MGGTAISALTTVKLVDAYGMANPFLVTAAVLAVYAVVAALLLRDAPGRTVPAESLGHRMAATCKLGITWQASALYAVAFGGYVAFSVYLPTYLKTGYGLTQADAANRMAGFVLLAVAMRPMGGWLSDRLGPVKVLAGSLAVVLAGALAQSPTPALMPVVRSPSSPWPPRSVRAAAPCSPWSPSSRRRTRSVRSPAWWARPADSAASSRRW